MLFSQKKQEELSAEGDIVLKVKDVSKFYQIYSKPKDRLKQSIFPKLQNILGIQKKEYFKIFWALKKISFDIKKGETVGIIGPNGSGKSTLLQIILVPYLLQRKCIIKGSSISSRIRFRV